MTESRRDIVHIDRQAECPWIAIVGGYGYHERDWRFTPAFATFAHGVLPVTTATTPQTNLGTGEVVDAPRVFATAADDLLVEGVVELQADRVNVHVAPELSSHLGFDLDPPASVADDASAVICGSCVAIEMPPTAPSGRRSLAKASDGFHQTGQVSEVVLSQLVSSWGSTT